MRIYCINMARRFDRWANMLVRFEAQQLALDRIEAVTPAELTPDLVKRYCNPMAYRWQTAGELSCSLSHQKAMRTFLQTGAPFAMIVEDDILLSPSLAQFLADFEAAPPPIDLLRLETDMSRLRLVPTPERTIAGYGVQRLHSAGGGAAGYIVSRRAAERIVAGQEILADLTDQALFNPYSRLARQLVMRQLSPALLVQEDRANLGGDRLAMSDLESLRRQRGSSDQKLFWRRWAYNFYDIVHRDIIGAARNLWLKHARGVVKFAIPLKSD